MSEVALPVRTNPNLDSGVRLCARQDLVANSGVVVWHDGHQIALFLICHPPEFAGDSRASPPDAAGESLSSLPDAAGELYALDNHDPFSGANVIGRGIVGDLQGELVVASPIYKQHFRLRDGQCLEDADQRLRHWPVVLDGNDVVLQREGPSARS